MARKPMVTRTITTTEVNVLCLDIINAEPCNRTVVISRTYKDDSKLLKKVEELINSDTIKAVHIVDKKEIDKMYGMPEQEFIENAVELDPETRREYETEETTENTEN